MTTALVVGSGPNGLAAAVSLAKEGVQVTVLEAADEIGGGTRSSEAILPGLLHDHCSAFHPMAVGSTFLNSLGLERYGLQWRWPEIDCAHPLDGGDAGVLRRSLDHTAAGLGSDGPRWRSIFGEPSATFDVLAEDIMGPLLRVPKHPLALARFGLPTVLPASTFAKVFPHRACTVIVRWCCCTYVKAASLPDDICDRSWDHHRRTPTNGWPVAAGGSQSITTALASLLGDLGGKIETGVRIDSASQLPGSEITMFDPAPRAIADILGYQLPDRIARGLQRFRHGPGAFKVDFAVEGGVPWPIPTHAGPGPSTSAATMRKSQPRNATSMPAGCRTGRSFSWVSSTWRTRVAPWETCTRCGPMPMSHMAIQAMRPRPSPHRSSGSPRVFAIGSSGRSSARQPRWRCTTPTMSAGTSSRSQGYPSARVRTTHNAEPVPPWDTGNVYLFGGHAAPGLARTELRRRRRRRRTVAPAAAKLNT